jgi:DNA-directed RNA polymerase subunit RPC12/RpoP
MEIKCVCSNCLEHLEFEESAVGATVSCPHCGKATVLFIPYTPTEAPPQSKRAKLIDQTTSENVSVEGRLNFEQVDEYGRSAELEVKLETAGSTLFFVGIAGGVLGVFGAVGSAETNTVEATFCFVIGVAAVVQGFVIRLLFQTGAEIVRLLKYSNRRKFTGTITQVSVHHSYKCSLCNASAQPAQIRCDRCGAEFSG